MYATHDTNEIEDVQAQLDRMRNIFRSGVTLPVTFRRQALSCLKEELKKNENRILDALQQDLGKSPFEGYVTELGLVYEEINLCLKKLHLWAKPRHAATPSVHFPSTSKVYPYPYGVVLVESPWNYPVQLTLIPLVDAIAAGNCVAVKPASTSATVSSVMVDIITKVFPDDYICAFRPGGNIDDLLQGVAWDKIFFTGSPRVGKIIMEHAAKFLTPVTLELGGKSPCIVDETANIRRAAERIAWGKGLNSGQTCVAPDYILAHKSIADRLVCELDKSFHQFYGNDILKSSDWPKMINRKAFDRVSNLIEERNPNSYIAFGGRRNEETLQIEPTCIRGVTPEDAVMQEEIFGPVLPIIEYSHFEDVLDLVHNLPAYPLAAYVFSNSTQMQQEVLEKLQFGGATINDVVIHSSNNRLGFGGVGNSGMGAYHGKVGFDCFTHYKSVMKKSTLVETGIRNPPFNKSKMKLAQLFMH